MQLGERVLVSITEGEFSGAEATVDKILGWPVFAVAVRKMTAFQEAEGPAAEMAALTSLYEFFEAEARPVWNLEDGRGPVAPTSAGMARVPVKVVGALYDLWVETFPRPAPSAVDEVIPPGPLRDELNAGLKAARKD